MFSVSYSVLFLMHAYRNIFKVSGNSAVDVQLLWFSTMDAAFFQVL